MAAIKFKSALGVDRSCEDGFGGIDSTARGRSGNKCYRMENLNVNADGSLSSRCGYKPALELTGEFRGSFRSADMLYAVIGSSFAVIDPENGTATELAALSSESGEADIFCYNGEIYLLDGSRLYRYDGAELTAVEGYAPLYAKEAHPSYPGAVYEDVNVLSDRIRMSFSVVGTITGFNLGIKVSSVDLVELNGVQYPASSFNMKIDGDDPSRVNCTSISGSSYVVLWLTLAPESSQMHRLAKTTKAFVFGNNGGERLCCYNPDISGHLLCSKPISAADQAESVRSAADALPLYMPISSSACIGDGASPITGMAQHYGRAILFTDTDAWCVDWEDDETNVERALPKIFLLNSAIGGEMTQGSAYCENDPLTYFCNTLWRWHSQSGVRDECSASPISDEIREHLPKTPDRISMLSIPQRQLIMISAVNDPEGRIIVFNTHLNTWTLYGGIYAEALLEWGDRPGFLRGGCIYVFSDDLTEDTDEGEGLAVSSSLTSHFTDFGCPERTKRSVTFILTADLGGGAATLTLENERGEEVSWRIKGKEAGGFEQISERIYLPAYKKLRYTLCAELPARYRSIILSAK